MYISTREVVVEYEECTKNSEIQKEQKKEHTTTTTTTTTKTTLTHPKLDDDYE